MATAILVMEILSPGGIALEGAGWVVGFGMLAIILSMPHTIAYSVVAAPILDLILPNWKHVWIFAAIVGAIIGQSIIDQFNLQDRLRGGDARDNVWLASYYGGFIGAFFGYVRGRLIYARKEKAEPLETDASVRDAALK